MAVLEPFITALLALALATLFVHFSARILMEDSTAMKAFLGVLLGTALAFLVDLGAQSVDALTGPITAILVLGAFALALAMVYRSSWLKGALVGFVAWIMWILANSIVGAILD